MVSLIKLVCPNCGANLEVDEKLSQCFCQYCGVKILLHNENEHVTRIVNEADLAWQENERRRLEFEQQKYEDKKEKERTSGSKAKRIILSILLGYASIMVGMYAFQVLPRGGIKGIADGFLLIGSIILAWYGRYIIYGKTTLNKHTGIAFMIAAGIIAAIGCKLALTIIIRG